MIESLGRIVILVNDYDDALSFYQGKLGFEPIVDMTTEEGQRFVHVRLPEQANVGIWLLEPVSDADRGRVGKQTGGEPCAVFYTDDCYQTYEQLRERGVQFHSAPDEEERAIVAHFNDLYGNHMVLVQLMDAS